VHRKIKRTAAVQYKNQRQSRQPLTRKGKARLLPDGTQVAKLKLHLARAQERNRATKAAMAPSAAAQKAKTASSRAMKFDVHRKGTGQ